MTQADIEADCWKAAEKILWHRVAPLDAYGQEELVRASSIIKSIIEKALRPYLALTGKSDEVIEIDEQGKVTPSPATASAEWTSVSANYSDGDGRPYLTAKCGEVQLFTGPENTVNAAINAHNATLQPQSGDTKRLDLLLAHLERLWGATLTRSWVDNVISKSVTK